jgi:predicted nucleic acid-binding protein
VQECRDPKDDKVLELALSGEAQYIISGDWDVLALNPFCNVPVITVVEFLKMMKSDR